MEKLILHCPINCEEYCIQEIREKIPNILRQRYKLTKIDRGTLSLSLQIQSSDELKNWIKILENCYTIEKIRIILKSERVPSDLQKSKPGKTNRLRFIEGFLKNALDKLVHFDFPPSLTLIMNMQHWKDISQREIQGLFKTIAQNHIIPFQFLMKGGETELRLSLTFQELRITINIPVQTIFSQLKVHPTPVFPSVAYVMLKLGLKQYPQANRFIDAMCGAGNIALIVSKVLERKKSIFIGAFDKDINYINMARDNASILKINNIQFSVFDLLRKDFDTTFPYRNFDLLLAHPPYGHFVQYSKDVLINLYQNLLQIFQTHGQDQACLVINSPRSDILSSLISNFSFLMVQKLEIPRKFTVIDIWVILK